MAFLVTQFVLNLVLGLGRVGNLLVHVRCVDQADKALGMAVQEVSLALIAFIPGEVILSSYWSILSILASYWSMLAGTHWQPDAGDGGVSTARRPEKVGHI